MIKEAEALRLKKWVDKAEKKGAKILKWWCVEQEHI